ncbi:MAG: 50S ribosomal protein L15 [Candidatus Uhrbacteria bacterium]|nr:50S ribosomal protein L15 [Candidatus Uhrbacteria bacterium]
MSLTLNTLTPRPRSRTKKFRIGRGLGSGRGKTAGRGTKGQRARTGGKKRLGLKGLKQMLLGFPKSRGFTSRREKPVTITLERLAKHFSDGAVIQIKNLKEVELMPRQSRIAKIVGSGSVEKKFTIQGILVTASAKAAIEKAGGSIKKGVMRNG